VDIKANRFEFFLYVVKCLFIEKPFPLLMTAESRPLYEAGPDAIIRYSLHFGRKRLFAQDIFVPRDVNEPSPSPLEELTSVIPKEGTTSFLPTRILLHPDAPRTKSAPCLKHGLFFFLGKTEIVSHWRFSSFLLGESRPSPSWTDPRSFPL